MKKTPILFLTRTAVFLALITVVQMLSKPLGQLVTGAVVNTMLILSTLLCGLPCGLSVAVFTPVLAFFLGIGPALPPILPFIILGNTVLVCLWYGGLARQKENPRGYRRLAVPVLLVSACAKCLVLYLGIVKLAVPVLLHLPESKAAALSASFSLPQLFTALAGGSLALLIFPLVRRTVERPKE